MDKVYKLNEEAKFRLRSQIYSMEKENQKDKKLSDSDMKKAIIKLIEKEVKKCY